MTTKELRKEWCEKKGFNYIDFETLSQAEEYILFLEERIEALTIPNVSQQSELLMATLTSRVLTIQNEPDGIVRETMINNLLIDINCG